MSFLYNLIQGKILNSQRDRDSRRDFETERKRKRAGVDSTAQREEPSDSEVDLQNDLNASNLDESATDPATLLDAREDVAYTQESDVHTRDKFQSTHVPMTICSMVAFACNRRHNGLALLNSVSFLASGVPQRVNDYLQSLGLTSSVSTANKCMLTLKKKTKEILRNRCAQDYVFQPLITADNIDIMKRVHHTRVEE